ncbi:MAG: hypothetical protein JNJ93_09200 [Acinetobacter sp.]|nr:hypothetical protein [Acinetobacter sp.]
MLKMMDVLEQSLVQNFSDSLFSPAEQCDAQFSQELLNVADIDLQNIVSAFFMRADAADIAHALDIQAETAEAIQAGADLKDEAFMAATAKIVAYCLAVETGAFNQVDVPDSLQDYPM